MAVNKTLGKDVAASLVSDIVDMWETWKGGGENGRQPKEEIWAECDEAFKSQLPAGSDVHEFRSKRYFPEIYKAVMNFVSTSTRSMGLGGKFATAMGMNEEASRKANLRTQFMMNRLDGGRFSQKFAYNHFLPLSVFGSSPYLLEWDATRSRYRRQKWGPKGQEKAGIKPYTYKVKVPTVDPTGLAGMEEVTRTYDPLSYVYDGPSFRPIDLFNFVIDPAHPNQHSAIKIYRYFMPKTELRKRAEEENSDGETLYDSATVRALLDEDAETDLEQSDSTAQSRSQIYGTNVVPSGGSEGSGNMTEIWYIHGDFPVEGGMLENYIIEIGNRRHLLRAEPSPYTCGLAPMRLATLTPVPGETYGLGIVESALGLADAQNAFHNQMIDAVQLELNPITIVKSDGVIDVDNLISAPGEVWEEEESGNIRALPSQIGQIIQGLAPLNNLERMLVDATHSHINFGATRSNETATATAVAASLAESTTGFLVRNVESDIERHILPFFDEVEKQYWNEDEDVYARYTDDAGGTKFEKVTADVIYQDYEWKAQGSGAAQTKALVQQTLLHWGAAAQASPAAASVDFEAWLKQGLELAGLRDADKLVPGFEEMAQKTGSIANQIAQGGGGARAGPPGGGANGTPGMAPLGRGPIPNAGGSQELAEAGRGGGLR